MEPTLVEQLVAQLVPVIITFVVTAVGTAGSWVLLELKKKLRTDRQRKLYDLFDQAARNAALDVEQTLVPQIREAASDGVVTPEEWREALDAATARVKTHVGKGMADLGEFLTGPQMDELIRSLVEAAVNRMHQFEPILAELSETETKEEVVR